jgi:MOSC domain-containing protein YiiM
VNVGQPRVIGERDGAPLLSAIGKQPVGATSITVRRLGLDGDAQANLRVHGGPDKAVYAYPADHWTWWEEKRIGCWPARFGENLTVEGAEETQVQVGDRFSWGDVVLEVSQPRSPRPATSSNAIPDGRMSAPS